MSIRIPLAPTSSGLCPARIEAALTAAQFEALTQGCRAHGLSWEHWVEHPAARNFVLWSLCGREVRRREADGLSRPEACEETAALFNLTPRAVRELVDRTAARSKSA